jgi:hypothetical protein
VAINNIKNIADEFIRDRTQADVDYALGLERDGVYTEENLKGAYNISDRNRVGRTVNYIADCLKDTGKHEVYINIKDDWAVYDIIKPEDHEKVLASLIYLKYLLPYDKTETVPQNLDSLTYQKANTVENILYDIYGVFSRLLDSWLYCGEAYASEFVDWGEYK